ncbi:hypothetical protein AC579_286 [Pseudocercospora musae]|uniref:Uncharacterized protein n=1 Tax=Pseudocercospora musae TaxID=113226 RepID=A0A139HFZ2_9PEZI|nr:hypothetical protein AC579_286 [Pseudocercospora musae]
MAANYVNIGLRRSDAKHAIPKDQTRLCCSPSLVHLYPSQFYIAHLASSEPETYMKVRTTNAAGSDLDDRIIRVLNLGLAGSSEQNTSTTVVYIATVVLRLACLFLSISGVDIELSPRRLRGEQSERHY